MDKNLISIHFKWNVNEISIDVQVALIPFHLMDNGVLGKFQVVFS